MKVYLLWDRQHIAIMDVFLKKKDAKDMQNCFTKDWSDDDERWTDGTYEIEEREVTT